MAAESLNGQWDFDDTRKVLGELGARMTVPGGISDVPTVINHLADQKGSHPAFPILDDNFKLLAVAGEDSMDETVAGQGLPVAIVWDADRKVVEETARLLALTGTNPDDPRFVEGVAYSGDMGSGVYVSINPADGGYAYPSCI